MDPVHDRRALTLVALTLVAASRLVDGPLLWLVAALLAAAVGLATLAVLGESEPRGVPIESLILPTVAALAGLGAIRLVPVDLWLVPGLAAAGLLILAALELERRLLAGPGADSDDRLLLVGLSLTVAFVAFAGAAALVPGGLAEPAPVGSGLLPTPAGGGALALLAGLDALLAAAIGYRLAAFRRPVLRDTLLAAATYGLVVGVGAGALRAAAVPRLLGPALLAVLVYLWDAWRGTPGQLRRSARWIWETALLILLAGVVVAWNLLVRP